MGWALVFSLYDCCPLTPPTLTHANTKLHPNNSPKVGQCLSFCLMTHFRQIGSYVIKRNEAIGGDDAELGTLKLTGDIQAKVRLCLITFTPVVLLFRASSCFSVSFFRSKSSALSHTLQAFQPLIVQLLLSCQADISPSRSIVSEGRGASVCVSSLTLFFCNGSCFSLQFWRTLLLRSEEAGYLPDSDCAEVITVLYLKKGVQAWGLGGGSLTHFHSVSHENTNFRQFRIQ